MQEFISHLLKSSALIAIFYLAYITLLKQETSFMQNRKFLLVGLATSLILPLIYLTQQEYIELPSTEIPYTVMNADIQQENVVIEEPTNWWQIGLYVYLFGVSLMSLRFGFQIYSLKKIINSGFLKKYKNLKLVKTNKDIKPFSFFNNIVYNPEKHHQKDLKLILKHEQIHAKQWHSLDVIFISVLCVVFWFNPFIWLYKKIIVQNLEFLADQDAVATIASKKEYQKALVMASVGLQPAMTNQFYQSFIKKRIIMLNKSKKKNTSWKTLVVIPFLCLFLYSFNLKTKSIVLESSEVENSQQQNDKVEIVDEKTIIQKENSVKKSKSDVLSSEKTSTPNIQQKENEETAISGNATFHAQKNSLKVLKDTLYILNGMPQPNKNFLSRIDKDNIQNITYLNGKKAVALYGEKVADYGVKLYTTKTQGDNLILKKPKTTDNTRIYLLGKTKVTKSGDGFTLKKINQENAPLIIINNKTASTEELNNLSSIKIASINVLKGEKAAEKYDDKNTENGVIEIYTKNYKGKLPQKSTTFVYTIHPNETDAAIQNMVKTIQEKYNIEIDIKKLKRDDSGMINSVKIKARHKGSSSWNVTYSSSSSDTIDEFYMIMDTKKDDFKITSEKPKKI
ncbi:M56 family metallopeptidase [Zunongwangia sp. HGR-M22]|uniref:M56 family metallopeptidase n=1 Tax=Zunongwangia sp. HGR-M22 TaxID=3015168 RepID=UPI0022DD873C|nr:M56 family metallopeptidase [Zunongwangia sp. HGR-M22]WBL26583.1 M56 family metallopeptidase [Zunongwangia sp. HGR-M22]